MEMQNVVFTVVDSMILNSYKTVLKGLSSYLGSGYEIVLHSLEDLDHSVIAIFNGERTGRTVGAPITDLALQMLARIEDENAQDSINYFNCRSEKETFKSATILIRGERDRAIGLLCINFDLNMPLSTLIQQMNPDVAVRPARVMETLVDHSDDLIASMVNETSAAVCADPDILPSNRNKEIVRRLYDRGIFKMKDAVVKVADLLGLSRNTVYMHLRNIEKK